MESSPDDLVLEVEVSASQLEAGERLVVALPNGREISFKLTPEFRHGCYLRLRPVGMEGDVLLRFRVEGTEGSREATAIEDGPPDGFSSEDDGEGVAVRKRSAFATLSRVADVAAGVSWISFALLAVLAFVLEVPWAWLGVLAVVWGLSTAVSGLGDGANFWYGLFREPAARNRAKAATSDELGKWLASADYPQAERDVYEREVRKRALEARGKKLGLLSWMSSGFAAGIISLGSLVTLFFAVVLPRLNPDMAKQGAWRSCGLIAGIGLIMTGILALWTRRK